MAYTKTTFVDGAEPAIDATELNKIGTGIEDAHTLADNHIADETNPHSVTATQASYDNADSGLTATNVKAAIDEVVTDLESEISTTGGEITALQNSIEAKYKLFLIIA